MSAIQSISKILKSILSATLLGFTCLCLMASSGFAQTTTPGQQVSLTAEIVENFVTAFPVVQERLDTFSAHNDAPATESPTDAMAAYLTYQQTSGELDAMVAEYGFDSFMSWVQTTSSVVTAYTFVREGGGMDDQFQQAIADIQNNSNFTADQKQTMIAQMTAAMQSVDAMRPDQANLDAVEPFTDELAVIFDDD